VSCQQPAAKGVGFVTMSIAILVAMRRTGFLPSDRRPTILVKSKDHVRTARALSAAAGHRGLRRRSSPADAELLVLPEAERSPPRDPLIPSVVRYDEQVLAALLPGSTVLVGSVRIHAPSQAWLVDSGAEMVRLGPSVEEFTDPVRRSVRRPEPVTVAGGRTAPSSVRRSCCAQAHCKV
jgi:hypothetical protein